MFSGGTGHARRGLAGRSDCEPALHRGAVRGERHAKNGGRAGRGCGGLCREAEGALVNLPGPGRARVLPIVEVVAGVVIVLAAAMLSGRCA